jgi:hypothetical protein
MMRIGMLILVLGAAPLHAQEAQRPQVPISYKHWLEIKDKPAAVSQLGAELPPVAVEGGPLPRPPLRGLSELRGLGDTAALSEVEGSNELRLLTGSELLRGLKSSSFGPEAMPAQLWSNLTNVAPGGPYNFGNPLLLTDGTVIVHRTATPDWYKLTPDSSGSYVNGTWSKVASMPLTYGPMYFASAVLPDGRVIAEGGEYNLGKQDWTSLGAIYDPTVGAGGAWTAIKPPNGWTKIGDGQSAVLANGKFILADCCDSPPFRAALLDLNHLTWSSTGTNKADLYDEEGWTLMPDEALLTVDAYTTAIGNMPCGLNTERYNPGTGAWSSAGNVPHQLADCNADNAEGGSNPSYEMGPQVLMYNGKVIAFGGTTANVAHTALYDTGAKQWIAGPDLPSTCGPASDSPCNLADAPATLLPSGNILFVASAGLFKPPANFFEYNPTNNSITAVPGTADASKITSYYANFLVLPTGQILAVENQTSTIQIYSPSGNVQDSWRPVVTGLSSPNCLARGESYVVSGKQLNGISQGASYGDDQQAATNYPLVRIVNNGTSHVFYARTSGHTTMSVASDTMGSTHFIVGKDVETGPSMIYVVANGIPSTGLAITVAASTCSAPSAK